jgi:hypothetical protein
MVFKSPDWSDYYYNQIQGAFQRSRQYKVIIASPTVYQVNIGNNRSHTVHLNSARSIWQSRKPELSSFEVSYTYNYLKDHFLLCKHVITVLQEAGEDLTSYYQMAS